MVLLDLLAKQKEFELIVAHFDHGIREDSEKDRQLVGRAAKKYGLKFEYVEGKLGSNASEDDARKARYGFLQKMQSKFDAKAIVTAHQQDDVIETAFINILRGTGRKGLTALGSGDRLQRPLLVYSKNELHAYAQANHLEWREDSTNEDINYLRNYVRQKIIPKLNEKDKEHIINSLINLRSVNQEIDEEIAKYLQNETTSKSELDKRLINDLAHDIACEVMAEWLRLNDIREFDSKTIERLVVAAKTLKPGQRVDINKKNYLHIDKNTLVISA